MIYYTVLLSYCTILYITILFIFMLTNSCIYNVHLRFGIFGSDLSQIVPIRANLTHFQGLNTTLLVGLTTASLILLLVLVLSVLTWACNLSKASDSCWLVIPSTVEQLHTHSNTDTVNSCVEERKDKRCWVDLTSSIKYKVKDKCLSKASESCSLVSPYGTLAHILLDCHRLQIIRRELLQK